LPHRTVRIFNSRSPRHYIRLTTPTSRHHYSVANQSSRRPAARRLAVGNTLRRRGCSCWSRRAGVAVGRGQSLSAASDTLAPASSATKHSCATTRDSSARHASSRCQYQSIGDKFHHGPIICVAGLVDASWLSLSLVQMCWLHRR